jgi:type VI secretion system protein ImpA
MSALASPLPSSLEPLLAPISPEAPSGRDLRYEGLYDRIREARREDDASLPQGIWKAPLKRADWAEVSALCEQALAHESKDLQLAAWLLEAWLAGHGFRGLELGLRLMTGLVQRYWDTAWPALGEGDTEARLSPLVWLDEKVSLALKQVPLVRPEVPETPVWRLADWERAAFLDKHPSGTEEAGEAEGVTRAGLLAAASLTPQPFFDALAGELTGVSQAALALERELDARLGREAAALRQLKTILGDIQHLVASLRGTPAPPGPVEPVLRDESSTEAPSPSEAGAAEPARSPYAIRGRADAYRMLAEAADYLLRTEPHSPVPYLVKRAVSWGELPLARVMQELVRTPEELSAIYALLGIREPK